MLMVVSASFSLLMSWMPISIAEPCRSGQYLDNVTNMCWTCRRCQQDSLTIHPCTPRADTQCLKCVDEISNTLIHKSNCIECQPCPVGFKVVRMCTDTAPTLCERCPKGTFNERLSYSSKCLPCTSCRRRRRKTIVQCSTERNAKCGNCKKGFYMDYGLKTCAKCRSCTTGQVKEPQCSNESRKRRCGIPVQSVVRTDVFYFTVENTTSDFTLQSTFKNNDTSTIVPSDTLPQHISLIIILCFFGLFLLYCVINKIRKNKRIVSRKRKTNWYSDDQIDEAKELRRLRHNMSNVSPGQNTYVEMNHLPRTITVGSMLFESQNGSINKNYISDRKDLYKLSAENTSLESSISGNSYGSCKDLLDKPFIQSFDSHSRRSEGVGDLHSCTSLNEDSEHPPPLPPRLPPPPSYPSHRHQQSKELQRQRCHQNRPHHQQEQHWKQEGDQDQPMGVEDDDHSSEDRSGPPPLNSPPPPPRRSVAEMDRPPPIPPRPCFLQTTIITSPKANSFVGYFSDETGRNEIIEQFKDAKKYDFKHDINTCIIVRSPTPDYVNGP